MRKFQRVEPERFGHRHSSSSSGRLQQREVVAQTVVSDHRTPVDKAVEVPKRLGRRRCGVESFVGEAGEVPGEVLQPSSRTHQRLERINLDAAGDQHRADLYDLAQGRIRPVGVGLEVEDHELHLSPTQFPTLDPSRRSALDARRVVAAMRGPSYSRLSRGGGRSGLFGVRLLRGRGVLGRRVGGCARLGRSLPARGCRRRWRRGGAGRRHRPE